MHVEAAIRFATVRDVPKLLNLIRELADYEHALDQVVATEQGLREELFSKRRAEALIVEVFDTRGTGSTTPDSEHSSSREHGAAALSGEYASSREHEAPTSSIIREPACMHGAVVPCIQRESGQKHGVNTLDDQCRERDERYVRCDRGERDERYMRGEHDERYAHGEHDERYRNGERVEHVEHAEGDAQNERAEHAEIVGMALFFHSFSTWLGKSGVYLEDLFVRPEWRGCGFGKALLSELARIAIERGCGRLEWSCLDWNRPSIEFYLALGACALDDWTCYRVEGKNLVTLASL